MSILEHEIRPAAAGGSPGDGLRRRLVNREEYYRLTGDERTELIEGEIIIMPPPGPRHRTISHDLFFILHKLFSDEHYVMHESAVILSDNSEPLPDLVVTTETRDAYVDRHPEYSEMRLVIEISDSTLYKDRRIKALLYASRRIPEYWIVNVDAGQLEVYLNPTDEGYDSPEIYRPGDIVAPRFAPEKTIAVSDFIIAG